jgi:glutaredoxin 3
MADHVTIFTLEACPYSELAKELLRRRGIPYQETVVAMDDDVQWETLIKRTGLRKMPQIFIGTITIGGYADLRALDSECELLSLDRLRNRLRSADASPPTTKARSRRSARRR